MASFVLSVLGTDRSGLVEALSGVVTNRGGNWEKSHMTQLAGKFAGVVLVTIPDSESQAFLADLAPLEDEGLFDISVESGSVSSAAGPDQILVEVVGNDHPGIVHEISHLLATRRVSIDDLQTWTTNAPMDGGRLFHARALLRLPADLEPRRLLADLEAVAHDLMVDVHRLDG